LPRISAVDEITVVDAVGMLVQKNKNPRWLRNIRYAKELDVMRIILVGAAHRDIARIAYHRVHRVTAHTLAPARPSLFVTQYMVAGTTVDVGRAGIRSQSRVGDG